MFNISIVIQLIVSLTILNVWLFRREKITAFRGGEAKTLREEFSVYGFSSWVYYAVGIAKVLTALAMFSAIWVEQLLLPSTFIMVIMMLVAFICHMKLRNDNFSKAIPATSILVLCCVLMMIET